MRPPSCAPHIFHCFNALHLGFALISGHMGRLLIAVKFLELLPGVIGPGGGDAPMQFTPILKATTGQVDLEDVPPLVSRRLGPRVRH